MRMRSTRWTIVGTMVSALVVGVISPRLSQAASKQEVRNSVKKGLKFLAGQQDARGSFSANGGTYPIAMTGLAGMAFLMDGNTTTEGRYAKNVRRAVEYLLDECKGNGLIGDPKYNSRYTYGHGFSMLFLSQVLGEEDDPSTRRKLVAALGKAVKWSGRAQTKAGGWGYVSAETGNNFDEGSTCITQMQGLRACRNAGITVPKSIIDKGVDYIHKCTGADGGVRYQLRSRGGGGRPPITAAAVACLFSAGEYKDNNIKKMIEFCDRNLGVGAGGRSYGHWHYAHYYMCQVMYRRGDKKWNAYKGKIADKIISDQGSGGEWTGNVGAVYVTALNLAILQVDNGYLPIYQR